MLVLGRGVSADPAGGSGGRGRQSRYMELPQHAAVTVSPADAPRHMPSVQAAAPRPTTWSTCWTAHGVSACPTSTRPNSG